MDGTDLRRPLQGDCGRHFEQKHRRATRHCEDLRRGRGTRPIELAVSHRATQYQPGRLEPPPYSDPGRWPLAFLPHRGHSAQAVGRAAAGTGAASRVGPARRCHDLRLLERPRTDLLLPLTFHADFSTPSPYPAGRPRGSRNHQPPADAPFRTHSQGRSRGLYLSTIGAADHQEGRGHYSGGDEPRRSARTADAHRLSRRTLERDRSLEFLWEGVDAFQGSARTGFLPWPDSRGSDHRLIPPRSSLLSTAAAEFLPNPNKIPR